MVLQWFQSVVLPSWILINGMRKEIEDLCDGMRRKDEEITEYQLEGAVLSRRKPHPSTFFALLIVK